MTIWYLAGPMSNIPQFNFPEFDRVSAALRAQGAVIVSPAEMDDQETRAAALASPDGILTARGQTWGDFLARDLKLIADKCDGVIVMPYWGSSKGARQELFTALNCGKRVADLIEGVDGTFAIYERRPDYFLPCLFENILIRASTLKEITR